MGILIIGGGLGGLFTGALLAKEGYKVTVVEKNRIIGGGLQCFKYRGTIYETGMHILGGFQEGGSLFKICSYLGIMDRLSIRHTDPEAMAKVIFLSARKEFLIPQGKENVIRYLSEKFPHEKENIVAYIHDLYRISEEVDLFYLRKSDNGLVRDSEHFLWAADDLIRYYVKDERLQALLAYMNPMYGGVAGHTPAFVHSLINVLYMNGSSQFNDGGQLLANLLVEIILHAGGRVITDDAVTRVTVNNKSIEVVHTGKGRELKADIYISDIHPCSLFEIIDKEAFSRSYRNRLSEIPNSYSAFTVYIKFKENSFPYLNYPCYYMEDYSLAWNLWEYDEEKWPKGFMYLTPPTRAQGDYANRMTINCIMKFDVVKRWQDTFIRNRGKEYEQWKDNCKQRVLNKMEQLYPGFRGLIEYSFASSPLTIRDYYGVKEGSLYGFQKDCKNILLSQVPMFTKVKNLLLTGQNVNLHGICGVPLTAIETAEVIVGKGGIVDKINSISLK